MKRKLIKLMHLIVLLLSVAMFLISCEPKPKDDFGGSTGKKNPIQTLIRNDIRELDKTTDWNMANERYNMIMSDVVDKKFQIPKSVQNDLATLANEAFCHSMDTIMDIILGDCSLEKHGELDAIHKRRSEEPFSEVALTQYHNDVDQKYKEHEKWENEVKKLKKFNQRLSSFKDPYDVAAETNRKNEASKILAEKPSCKWIAEESKNISDGKYDKIWLSRYCGTVVDLYKEYLKKSEWHKNDVEVIKGNIKSACKRKNEDFTKWFDKIDELREEKQ